MRLIDVDELRWAIRNNAPKSVSIWVYQTINNAPTAYDPDKVVQQLEDYLFEKYCVEGDSEIERIVKGGEVDG